MTLAPPAAGLAELESPLAKVSGENFPVALRLLPAAVRRDLLALYGFARLVDDLGDELPGGPGVRLRALSEAESELDRAMSGSATHPVFVELSRTIARHGLQRQDFAALIEANRLDQQVTHYATYEQLIGYCELSANPVGRLVLSVFGVRSEEADHLSDLVCTGLQLVEHWQDVAEDAAAGRVYLPGEDMEAFGVPESELAGGKAASPAFRRLLAFEAGRARDMLREGAGLVRLVRASGAHGRWAAVATAGFCGGGLAQVAALERACFDALAAPVKAPRTAVAGTTARLLAGAVRRPGGGRPVATNRRGR